MIRYLPSWPLPARAHEPGLTPRPQVVAGPRAPLPSDPDDRAGAWRRHPAYLWGVDLYNHGFPWEAHEVWEPLWRHAPRGSSVKHMLQGLIQCAAIAVHERAGRGGGIAALTARARGHFDAVLAAGERRCLGLDVAAVRAMPRCLALVELGPPA